MANIEVSVFPGILQHQDAGNNCDGQRHDDELQNTG
jgi:hypothetical protein